MYFTYFNFISDQPGLPPARIREGAELVRGRKEEEPGQPHKHGWPGPLVHTAGIRRTCPLRLGKGQIGRSPLRLQLWRGSFLQAGKGGWQCPLLCCQWPLEGASPGLQVDCCDICGGAGLAGPLAAGAPGCFGSWAGGGLGGFPEALPECSFNLLLTGSQAVHFSACDPCQQLCELVPGYGARTQALHCSPNAARGDHGWWVHGEGVILERKKRNHEARRASRTAGVDLLFLRKCQAA